MGAVVDRTDVIRQLIGDQGYTLSEACEEPLRNYYARRQADDARTAGNGRLARNTLERPFSTRAAASSPSPPPRWMCSCRAI